MAALNEYGPIRRIALRHARDAFRDPPPMDSSFGNNDQFYGALAAYGDWVRHGRYGSVFVPHRHVTGRNWRPYTRGQWQYTQYGWSFASAMLTFTCSSVKRRSSGAESRLATISAISSRTRGRSNATMECVARSPVTRPPFVLICCTA